MKVLIMIPDFRHDATSWSVFSITVIFNVFGWPYTSMVPVIGTDYLKLGPEGVGLLAGSAATLKPRPDGP